MLITLHVGTGGENPINVANAAVTISNFIAMQDVLSNMDWNESLPC